MLDALGIPHSPAETRQLFQSSVGMDVYSYLQVILFPQEAKASDFERILKRPNKLLSNPLIAQAKDWDSFLHLHEIATLRDWERQTLADFTARIERFSQTAHPGKMTAADCMQILKTEFGLTEFYQELSRLSDDLDQASDEGLLDVITALAGTFKTPQEFFQFTSKSLADASREGEITSEREAANPNEVYLSTIHRAKGKEFRNVVYFNLSQTAADPNAANSQRPSFVEEERRITYVGATRSKDDLLITFASTKPSDFLREIALNPGYRELEEEDLNLGFTSASLHLERARVVLKQLEEQKEYELGTFRALTKAQAGQGPAWLRWLLNKIQLWRIDRALARVEGIERQIKSHKEETIAPLEREIQAIEEDRKMRAALLGKPIPQSLSAHLLGEKEFSSVLEK
jgi:ATP-dependent exoDNAse (exonuclease V) beta subunit